MFINNYILKNESTGQLTIFWKLEQYVNLAKENEYFRYLYNNVDKFVIKPVNNDKFLFLEYGNVRYLVSFYRHTFYDVCKLCLPKDVNEINDISIIDIFRYENEKDNIRTVIKRILKINGQKYNIEFDYDNFEIIATPANEN